MHIKRSFAVNSMGTQCIRHIVTLKRKDVITMVCATVKEGVECAFMSKKGCKFNGGNCHIIVEQCEGCQKIFEGPTGKYCMIFPDPSIKWRAGNCNMATM